MAKFDDLVDLIASIQQKGLLEDFLFGLTTDNERKEFVQRVEIIKKLLQGESQHQIAKDLGVGIATITRGSKELSKGRFKILQK